MNKLCLVVLAILVSSLVLFVAGFAIGGINSRRLAEYRAAAAIEANKSAYLVNDLTTQLHTLEESLRQVRGNLAEYKLSQAHCILLKKISL